MPRKDWGKKGVKVFGSTHNEFLKAQTFEKVRMKEGKHTVLKLEGDFPSRSLRDNYYITRKKWWIVRWWTD